MMRAIDLFAGLGGYTCGAEMSDVDVIWAANHWPLAVEFHAKNHLNTTHNCQDLQQANWLDVPQHDILLASPACQGHSRARGKERPHHNATRSTAWAVVSALETHKTPLAVIENVTEFCKWSLYPSWCDALARLGYAIAPHIVNASDHGLAQNRERVFIVLSRSRAPLFLDLKKSMTHIPCETIIDWDSHNFKSINSKKRAQSTLDQIKAGHKKHGDRFLIAYYGNESNGRSIKKPLGTVTTKDRFAVIQGDEVRMLSIAESKRAMGFSDSYLLPDKHADALKMLGNAVCPPVARDVINAVKAAA